MKQLISFDPQFDPANKTVDFKFYLGGFQLDRLYSIVNITQGTPIYIPGVAGYGYTDFDGTKITLAYDTTSHKSTDVLNVYYEEPSSNINNTAKEKDGNLEKLVETMDMILVELKTITLVLGSGLNVVEEDIVTLRDSITLDN